MRFGFGVRGLSVCVIRICTDTRARVRGVAAFFDANKAALVSKLEEAVRTSSTHEVLAEQYLCARKQVKPRRR